MKAANSSPSQEARANEVISEDDDDFAVVGLDLELADLSRFNMRGFPLVGPPAGAAAGAGRTGGRQQGKRGNEKGKGGIGFRRKDRLFFAGPPPPVPATESTELDPQNFLVVANLHWIISDADIWDGGCSYGPVRGVCVFEEPVRKKSEGVALVEFVSQGGPANARKDAGRAWSAKQSDRPVHLFGVTDAVISALETQIGASTMEEAPHWTRTSSVSPALVSAVLACAGKTPSIVPVQHVNGAQQESPTNPTLEKNIDTSEQFTLPLAIQALIEELKENDSKAANH
eukprot:Gregarina_sp_Pseudo_9__1974@NODE_2366_length_1024_cov_4_204061_g2179_i0_p1_GENE_NODE_2366_length_1024_cov_4_204061_g2179_i0NODE_2366_length_1024_cov_4_204061_g2179_i0_p1_ORF_typecomplete_len286_score26_49RRM_1/PF00076_22/4_3e05_NODE_2366_length_1024_cov_4_204061_g2179_i030887